MVDAAQVLHVRFVVLVPTDVSTNLGCVGYKLCRYEDGSQHNRARFFARRSWFHQRLAEVYRTKPRRLATRGELLARQMGESYRLPNHTLSAEDPCHESCRPKLTQILCGAPLDNTPAEKDRVAQASPPRRVFWIVAVSWTVLSGSGVAKRHEQATHNNNLRLPALLLQEVLRLRKPAGLLHEAVDAPVVLHCRQPIPQDLGLCVEPLAAQRRTERTGAGEGESVEAQPPVGQLRHSLGGNDRARTP